jgi:hypothetical protein
MEIRSLPPGEGNSLGDLDPSRQGREIHREIKWTKPLPAFLCRAEKYLSYYLLKTDSVIKKTLKLSELWPIIRLSKTII